MSDHTDRTPATGALSPSTLFDLLSDSRRRAVLADLSTREGELTVTELANAIAVREQDCPLTDVSDETMARIRISLRHKHLPKLAETPLVEYDERRAVLEPTAQLAELAPFLSRVAEADSVHSLSEGWREYR